MLFYDQKFCENIADANVKSKQTREIFVIGLFFGACNVTCLPQHSMQAASFCDLKLLSYDLVLDAMSLDPII